MKTTYFIATITLLLKTKYRFKRVLYNQLLVCYHLAFNTKVYLMLASDEKHEK